MMFNVLSGLWILASGFSAAQTQPFTQEELNAQLHLQAKPNFQRLPTGEKIFNWIGQSGFTYFIQASPDLLDWTWAPEIESGIDGPMSYEVDGPTAAGFFRLVRTDQTAVDLDAADFDGDGFSNNFELTPRPRPGGIVGFTGLNPNIQTNPLRADTDGDGLTDKWELDNGFDPTDNGTRRRDNGADGDPDHDGVTNLNEQRLGTQPKGNATTTDSDADGTLDFEDAVPGDNLVSWKRTVESSYALIEISAPSATSSAQDLNDKGEVLFANGIWAGGEWIPRQAANLSGADPNQNSYGASVGDWHAFNSDRKLLGTAHLTFTEGEGAGGDGLGSPAYWINGQSSASLMVETANLWGNPHSTFTPISVSANGNLIVRSRRMNGIRRIERYNSSGALLAQMDGSDDYHPEGFSDHADGTGTGWVASNLSRSASTGQTTAHKVGLWDASNYPIALPAEANGWGSPVRTKDLPNGKVVLTAGATNGNTPTGRVFLPNPSGEYEYATKLADKHIELFAGDGSALTSDNKLWRNGEVTPMADLCPRYKELLETGNTIHPHRANKDGTYLVQVQSAASPPTTTAALLVPVKVEWRALTGFDNVDDHKDPWTNAINGKRIFPDYKDPNDTEIRHKLELVVTVSPAMAGQNIYVKAFDVDDSTDETFDKDDSGAVVIDTNGKAGTDNLSDFLGTSQSGQFLTGSAWGGDTANAVVATNGEAKFVFRVGMQPGSNYRVVASLLNNSDYSGVQTTNSEAAKYLGPAAAQNGGSHSSTLLTVWRKLWIENDSMGAIPVDTYGYKKNDLKSSVEPALINTITLNSEGDTSFGLPSIIDQSSYFDLENGRIIIQSNSYPVIGTGFESFEVTVAGDRTGIADHSEFRLFDDDGYGLNADALPRNDLVSSEMAKVFRPAFIEIKDAASYNPRELIEFWRNYTVMIGPWFPINLQHAGIWDDAIDLTDCNERWVGNLISGYQGNVLQDRDPSSETSSNGITNPERKYSIVYVETLRDSFDSSFRNSPARSAQTNLQLMKDIVLTASHELAHMPGGGNEATHHSEGSLMDALGTSGGTAFNAKTIMRFRSTSKWEQP